MSVARAAWLLGRAAAVLLLAAGSALAADPPAISSDEARAILDELRQIRALLERMQAPPAQPAAALAPQQEGPVSMRVTGAYVLGKVDAPVTMVEFSDYECPFCRQFHMTSFEELKRKYIDTGKMRYVSRDFPLEFHSQALPAAKMALCAGEQGRFWEMRRALIVNGNALGPDVMANLGKDLKLDEKGLQACIADKSLDAALQRDIAEARTLGVSGTPTFVIGRSNGESVEGTRIVGALPLATFEGRIDALLASPQ